MTNLYTLTTEIQQRIDTALECDWIPETTMNTLLEGIKADALQQQQSVAAYILNQRSNIEQMKQYINNMKERIHSAEKKVDKLENLLKWSMKSLDQVKVECGEFTIKLKKTPPKVIINNDDLIPEEFMRVKTIREPDKNKIADELKREGGNVAGCHLESGERLEIK